jgi:hypothetical protein
VAELAVPSWAPAQVAPMDSATPLPPVHAQTLLRLARLGHAQGLQRALDTLAHEHSECITEVVQLRALVARFAWEELIERLSAALALNDRAVAS